MAFTTTRTILLLTVLVVLLPTGTLAFGAGDIPDFAYLNDKAFRHGDIENIIVNVVKAAAAGGGGGGLLGFASSMLKEASGGSKFNKGDVKKIYFGNWLRDYSQAMDIGGLSKLSADTLLLIVSVLGFMTFGFATKEFEVTADRLGVYLPVEHIDNPKGYAEKEGDARQFHPKLRPPVDPRELDVDPRNGMKNYIASEGHSWDTSTAHIRRVFRGCIEYGRRAGGREGPDLYEAYRLLGTGLHTLEDLSAHSNWCELALRKMGHEQVFCHVGDDVLINTPNGPAPPLITGTFGGADFLHSLLGEATDHISQASVTDLSAKMDDAANSQDDTFGNLKGLLGKLPIGGGNDDQMSEGQNLADKSKAYHFNPDNVAPPEVQQQLWALLKWRDGVYRSILEKIEMIPGLSDLMDQLTNALNAYVYTVLAPWLSPILKQATGALGEGSKAVIDTHDQYEVFDNPRASDPSHSLLSKDHFGLILNEPAGKIAQVVVKHSVELIVGAWQNTNENPDQVIDTILEAFHHPYYATGRSRVQHAMFETIEQWIGGLGPDEGGEVLQALTKESVRNGKNKRRGSEDEQQVEAGYGQGYGYSSGQDAGSPQSRYGSSQQSRYESTGQSYGSDNRGSGGYGGGQYEFGDRGYSQGRDEYGGSQGGYQSRGGYEPSYGSSRQEQGYAEESRGSQPSYISGQNDYSSNAETYASSERRRDDYESSGYGAARSQDDRYGRKEESDYGNQSSYGNQGYGGREERSSGYDNEGSYGRRGDDSYGGDSYGSRQESSRYEEPGRSSGYAREEQSYGSRDGYGEERPSYGERSAYDTERSGGDGAERGGYGGETRDVYRDESRGAYEGESRGGYGGESSYGSNERSGGYSGERGGYGGESRGEYDRGGNEYGDSQETFGAERLNINERSDEGYSGGGGYEGGGYENNEYRQDY